MTIPPLDARLAPAKAMADAVLYEGYVLYPYRASADKNRFRWQWGLAGPPAAHRDGVGEDPVLHTDLLVAATDGGGGGGGGVIDLRVRFLQVQVRTIEAFDDTGETTPVEQAVVDGETWVSFDEAVEVSVDAEEVDVADVVDSSTSRRLDIAVDAAEEIEALGPAHRIVRHRRALTGTVEIETMPTEAADVHRVRVRVENTTTWSGPGNRDDASRSSFIGVHVLGVVRRGQFVSVLDAPEHMADAVGSCSQYRLWPVLVGSESVADLVLAAPLILYDQPEIAPESTGDFYDGLEIDELMSLRVMTLTDEEKVEARATDPRAAAIIDRVDAMGPDDLGVLHGAIRSLRTTDHEPDAPWWDPDVDASYSPDTDAALVNGVALARGAAVVLHPGRRADAHDIFYEGRRATVGAVLYDVDGAVHFAVTVDDDPAAELYDETGRYLYFSPDEVEPVVDR